MKIKNNLNNKGYMLIEIVLASVIAFGLAYFMLELTIKLKNKNDDLMVETLMATDNAIISNAIMRELQENNGNFDCSKITISDKKVSINGKFVTEVNEYANLSQCVDNDSSDTKKHIVIPMMIIGQNNKHFDVDLYYRIKQ